MRAVGREARVSFWPFPAGGHARRPGAFGFTAWAHGVWPQLLCYLARVPTDSLEPSDRICHPYRASLLPSCCQVFHLVSLGAPSPVDEGTNLSAGDGSVGSRIYLPDESERQTLAHLGLFNPRVAFDLSWTFAVKLKPFGSSFFRTTSTVSLSSSGSSCLLLLVQTVKGRQPKQPTVQLGGPHARRLSPSLGCVEGNRHRQSRAGKVGLM